jgi:hypothetical protein
MSILEFRNLCAVAWRERYSYLSINLEETELNKKYLINFKSLKMNLHKGEGLTENEYYRNLLAAYESNKNLLQAVKDARNQSFTSFLTNVERQKPLIESINRQTTDVSDVLKKNIEIERENKQELLQAIEDKTLTHQAITHAQPLTEEQIREYLIKADENDEFSLKLFDDENTRFRIYEKLNEIVTVNGQKAYTEGSDHSIEFNVGNQEIVCYKNARTAQYPLTEDLLIILTQDTLIVSDIAKKDFVQLVLFAIGSELEAVKKKGAVVERKHIVKLLRQNSKFVSLISNPIGIKGSGYKDLALMKTIVIPPNANERLNRFMVLYGSASAGNSNKDILTESSAILDSLLKDKLIDKMKYKLLYYKLKNRLEQNQKESIQVNN